MTARHLTALVGLAALVLLLGCETDPYCITCGDDMDGGVGDADIVDAQRDAFMPDRYVPDAGPPPDGGPADGCMGVEICNGLDDDCDGEVDEDFDTSRDVENCGGCGEICAPAHAFPQCVDGECQILRCDVGWHDLSDPDPPAPSDGCEYECVESATDDSICNELDDDCDGEVDEDVTFGTIDHCGGCAPCALPHAATQACVSDECQVVECDDGWYNLSEPAAPTPSDGCEYACTFVGAETCNGEDDDCDGVVDQMTRVCGTDEGVCTTGTETCTAGMWGGCDATTGGAELCDNLDNDCDGFRDEDLTRACSSACGAGTETCFEGSWVGCSAPLPTLEICNGADDDCDGAVDEDFDTDTSILHCGGCGNRCALANAVPFCLGGTCRVASCDSGYHNLDESDPPAATDPPSNGCEYDCTIRGAEVCNGLDDDCDGTIDEPAELSTPPNYCSATGACAGTTPTCGGTAGWVCDYTTRPGYEDSEETCDGIDNDCDGAIDEPFPRKGTFCTNGELGACLTTGTFVCNAAQDGVECTAPASSGSVPETCNGLDDDCDGVIDDGMTPSVIPTVAVPTSSGGVVHVMAYEASRPDADEAGTDPGSISTHACSNPGRIPWTTVTWYEARDACCALNASGTCSAGGTGWRLCDGAEWQIACEAGDSCRWSYGPTAGCSTSQPEACNGKEYDCDSSTSGDEDCLLTTASTLFPACYADWDAGGRIWDMSGNAREWTNTARGDYYETRGGDYASIEAGRRCDFGFRVNSPTFAHPSMGFRCCYYE